MPVIGARVPRYLRADENAAPVAHLKTSEYGVCSDEQRQTVLECRRRFAAVCQAIANNKGKQRA